MSIPFSNTTDRTGVIEMLEDLTDTQSATTSSYPLKTKTRDINLALDNYYIIANRAAGRRQTDDPNHIDTNVIFADIVSGQQDYSFTVDENSNQILDIYKVRVKTSGGVWTTLTQRDLQDGDDEPLNSTTTTTAPSKYDISSNTITLTAIPSYDSTDGMEIYCSRQPAHFLSTDTTKEVFVPVHPEYMALRPAYFYCLQKGLDQAVSYRIALYGQDGRSGMEKAIEKYYSERNRDERIAITAENKINYI